jgi:hypothetical protein
MMIYSIKAKFNPDRLEELFQKLTNGKIENQKPDGIEIINSMKRAKITEPGIVQWSEMCFCSPPLDHERQTVYDKYFAEMKITLIEDYVEFEGEQFFDYLKKLHHK